MSVARRCAGALAAVPAWVLIGLIRLYQIGVSPWLGPRCRYYPSCSSYGLEAVRVHGAVKGALLAAWRIGRCHPWSAGGFDGVPERGRWRGSSEQPALAGATGPVTSDNGGRSSLMSLAPRRGDC